MSRRLRVNLDDLELAFQSSDDESTWYLDLETGDVTMMPDESTHYRDEIA
jgi:hypothetical protein